MFSFILSLPVYAYNKRHDKGAIANWSLTMPQGSSKFGLTPGDLYNKANRSCQCTLYPRNSIKVVSHDCKICPNLYNTKE